MMRPSSIPTHAARARSVPRATPALFLGALCSLLNGCAVGPDHVRPAIKLPATFTEQGFESKPDTGRDAQNGRGKPVTPVLDAGDIPQHWWTVFESRELDALIKEGLAANPNIEAAQAAMRAAQENENAQRAALLPSVQASLAPTRQKVAGTLASGASSGATYYTMHTAQVTVGYTFDVFGGNRRLIEASQAQTQAQRYQYLASYQALAGNIANAAIQEAALREQIGAATDALEVQRKILDTVKKLYALGQMAAADLAAQESALANAEAALPPLQKQWVLQRDALKALLGRMPADALDSLSLDAFHLPAQLPVSLPAALLEHRPDIRAAEEQLHAAAAQVGVAQAARLPQLTLGVTSWGSASETLAHLFDKGTGFWNLAGSIAQPVFDGGALSARQRAAQASYEQSAAQYRATVIAAFQNVSDTLEALRYDGLSCDATARSEQAAWRSLEIARRQLALGDVSMQTVLGVQQTYLQARLAAIQARAARLSDVAALFVATGGGWWQAPASDTGAVAQNAASQ